MPNIKQWPPQHRNLLAIILVLTMVCMLVAVFHLRPRWMEYAEMRDEKAAIEAKLIKSSWSKDSERLKATLKELNKRLEKDNGHGMGLKDESNETLKKATSVFMPRIMQDYGDVDTFINNASLTEYQYQYKETEAKCRSMSVMLNGTMLGMDEHSSEDSKYQMMLKLYTLETLVTTLRNAGLMISLKMLDGPAQFGRMANTASNITIMPMKAYYINEDDNSPYLLEFPVKMEVIGKMDNLYAFMKAINSENLFLPLSKFEITVQPPANSLMQRPQGNGRNDWRNRRQQTEALKVDRNGNLTYDRIKATLVCSSFFMPGKIDKKNTGNAKETANVPKRPAGI